MSLRSRRAVTLAMRAAMRDAFRYTQDTALASMLYLARERGPGDRDGQAPLSVLRLDGV